MKCPGQDMKYWKDDAIFNEDCPKCGTSIEFYKDDTTRKCGNCGHRFVNPKMDFGCASYCQFAEQCLGTLPEDFVGSREDLLKDKVAVEMKRHYHADFKSIRKATNTARHAENIGKSEGGNLAVILCSAYLYGTGIAAAESILKKVGASEPMIDEICNLLKIQEDVPEDAPLSAKIIHDALMVEHMQELLKQESDEKENVQQMIEPKLFTASAKTLASSFVS